MMARAAAAVLASLRPTITTNAPAAENARTAARPIPSLAPVTTIVLPSNDGADDNGGVVANEDDNGVSGPAHARPESYPVNAIRWRFVRSPFQSVRDSGNRDRTK